jgi:hypothetical protein
MDIKTLLYKREDNIAKLVKCSVDDKEILRKIPHQPGEFSNAEPFHGQICNPGKHGDYYNYYKVSYQLPSFEKNIITPFTHIKIKKYTNKTVSILDKPGLSIWPHYNIYNKIEGEIDYNKGFIFIFKGGNIWAHFLLDVFPYLHFSKDILNDPEITLFLETPESSFNCLEYLIKEVLKINNKIVFVNKNQIIKIKNLFIIETVGPYASGLFPYQAYGNIPSILYKNTHDFISKQFLKQENILIYTKRNTPDTNRRKIFNEDIIEKILINFCNENNLKYVSFYCNDYSINQKIELFNKAKIVVGSHGGSNYHIYFCHKKTKFIEFVFPKDCHSCQLMALSFDLDYWQIPVENHGQFDNLISINKEFLESLVKILHEI